MDFQTFDDSENNGGRRVFHDTTPYYAQFTGKEIPTYLSVLHLQIEANAAQIAELKKRLETLQTVDKILMTLRQRVFQAVSEADMMDYAKTVLSESDPLLKQERNPTPLEKVWKDDSDEYDYDREVDEEHY